MPELQSSTIIERPPEAVFNLLADFANYSRWLPPSGLYGETLELSDSPIKKGTTYTDKGKTIPLRGIVTEFVPYSRLEFHQSSQKPNFTATIRYDLSRTEE